jgi:hypothetical protein
VDPEENAASALATGYTFFDVTGNAEEICAVEQVVA